MRFIQERVNESVTQIFIILIILYFILIAVIIFIARYISSPITKLSSISLKIAEVDYTAKINIKSKKLIMDFIVINKDDSIHVLNAISPAFTSSMEFAKLIVNDYIV